MAVSLRAASTKGFGVGYPISAPVGLADGDVVYIWIETAADSNARTLSGFTVLSTGNRAGTYVHLLRGEISGTPPSGFSPTNGVSGDNTICVALYDQDLTDEVVGTLMNEAGDGADQEIPGVTIADDDSYLLAFVASNGNTNPAVEALSSITNIGYATLRGDPVNAGATGSQTLVTTAQNPWSNYHFGVLVGVPPSGGAAPIDLTVADATVATTIDTVTLTQVHSLAVADLSVASTIDTVTLSVGAIDLTVADLAVACTVDTITLTQVHELDVADLAVGSSIDTVTITVGGIDLTVASIAIDTAIDTLALTQVHSLTVANLTVVTTVDTVTVAQVHNLTVADVAVVVTIDTVTLSDRPPDTDTKIAAAYREPAIAAVYREKAFAATYKGE